MAYSPQFGKTDTLASQMAAGATSATLSAGNFTNFTTDYLVIDYDNPSKREVILCNVTGTAVASATRGQDGTSDVTHAAGANVAYVFVPSHYANGLGAIAENDAWTTFAAAHTGFSSAPTQTCRYIQIGKTVFVQAGALNAAGTSNATTFTMTLPVASKYDLQLTLGRGTDNTSVSKTVRGDLAAGSTTLTLYTDVAGTGWTGSGTKGVSFSFSYEAN